jgi:transposase
MHEVLKMRFFDVHQKFIKGALGCDMAAEILGVSLSTFYRMRERYEDEGESGLVDGRIGKMSTRRVPADETMRLISLYETQYYDFTVKHFHEKLPEHGFKLSYTCVNNKLQEAGVVKRAKKHGQHRRKRERKPLPGMMLHQDGSMHEWVPGKKWDLIVTMDDATSESYSMFFCEEEGTQSSFKGLSETMTQNGLPCSLYVDRGSHYFVTDKAGGKVSQTHMTQVGRAMRQLGIEMIPAYSPEARGRSERMFGTLQKRLPQELRLRGITDMDEANRFLREIFLPEHNARFIKQAAIEGSAFTPLMGFDIQQVLCIQEERRVANDNTVQYKGTKIQILENASRCSFAKCTVRVHEYLDGSLGVFHGPRRLRTVALAKPEENTEVDFSDGFNASNSDLVWQDAEGSFREGAGIPVGSASIHSRPLAPLRTKREVPREAVEMCPFEIDLNPPSHGSVNSCAT